MLVCGKIVTSCRVILPLSTSHPTDNLLIFNILQFLWLAMSEWVKLSFWTFYAVKCCLFVCILFVAIFPRSTTENKYIIYEISQTNKANVEIFNLHSALCRCWCASWRPGTEQPSETCLCSDLLFTLLHTLASSWIMNVILCIPFFFHQRRIVWHSCARSSWSEKWKREMWCMMATMAYRQQALESQQYISYCASTLSSSHEMRNYVYASEECLSIF